MPIIAIFTLAGLILSMGIVIARELLSGRAFVADEVFAEGVPPAAAPLPVAAVAPEMPADDVVPTAPVPLRPTIEPVADVGPRTAVEPETDAEHAPRPEYLADDMDADLATMLEMVVERQKDGAGVRVLVVRGVEAAAEAPQGALALARGLARRSRVILVDCGADEGLDRLLAAPRGADAPAVRGLQNLLAGDTSFAEVIHRDPESRLHIVPLGTGSLDHLDAGFGMLVEALSGTYDHVVLAVPTLAPGRAVRGAALADIAILLVAKATDQQDLERDREALHLAGLPSVYVLDIDDLTDLPERSSAAA